MMNFIQKIFGTKNERELKRIAPLVDEINRFEPAVKKLSDEELRAKTAYFKEKLSNGASLDDILTEAFAAVREASWRTVGMRHFDSQLIGGIVLHEGKIAEMATGEGKTLVATMPVYLNALTGRGAQLVTVNDYLARRDADWMGPIYKFLGFCVGVIVHDLDDEERRKAYGCDVTYGTNNEFGFDYLRDNMKYSLEDFVQREFHYAIVDEVDSILVDEARTPLIISGPAEESTDKYYRINQLIHRMKKEKDFMIDEKAKSASLTEEGVARVEQALKVDNLYDPRIRRLLHHVNQALKAHELFKRDVDYIVKDGKVIIVDEFTGRLMPGRRFSDGLHQALEAKENVKIERENQTLATVTFQNFFRMYKKLAGMTGTADTEAVEFKEIYNLDVIVIPTNMPLIRTNYPDVVYRTEKEKFKAAIEEIEELHAGAGRCWSAPSPSSKSERWPRCSNGKGSRTIYSTRSSMNGRRRLLPRQGAWKAVTISTNMAGRGTDIKLGEGVAQLGGLHILGTERHESRRIDNQLRGRSGRQGDAGSSRFYLSLDDDLLRIFGGERIQSIMERIGIEEGQPIEANLLSKAIENAQRRVEAHNFDIRKHLLEFDNVMNVQREAIYEQRKDVLKGEDPWGMLEEMLDEVVETLVDIYVDEKQNPEDWNLKGLDDILYQLFSLKLRYSEADRERASREQMLEEIRSAVLAHLRRKEETFGKPLWDYLMKAIMLQSIDSFWKDHLLGMDHLREGIGLRGYGQKDPIREYQKEGYEMYVDMMHHVRQDTLQKLSLVQVQREEEVDDMRDRTQRDVVLTHGTAGAPVKQAKKEAGRVGRNDPCPCGSGKKYKKCCGK